PGPQMTASNCRSCGATQVGSCTVFSAQPTACPRSFTEVAKPLLPPSVSSAVMWPNSHLNPTQVCPLCEAGRKAAQLHASPFGSMLAVSEMPTTSPVLFSPGQATALLGPPRVPRSMGKPISQRTACAVASPVRLDSPADHPKSLTPLSALTLPPSGTPRLKTRYCRLR